MPRCNRSSYGTAGSLLVVCSAQAGMSYERIRRSASSRAWMLVVGAAKIESKRRWDAKTSTADRISTGHPIGVTVEDPGVHTFGSVDALVSAPGFPREEPNVWNLARPVSFLLLIIFEKLSRAQSDVHGSLAKEVPGAAVPLRDTGHDSSVEQPFSAFQVQAPSTGTALENIEDRQKYDCDQYSFVSLCGAIFC